MIMLVLVPYEIHIVATAPFKHLYTWVHPLWKCLFSNGNHFWAPSSCWQMSKVVCVKLFRQPFSVKLVNRTLRLHYACLPKQDLYDQIKAWQDYHKKTACIACNNWHWVICRGLIMSLCFEKITVYSQRGILYNELIDFHCLICQLCLRISFDLQFK